MNGVILSGHRQITQQELLGRVAKAASGLQRMGIGEEDAVAIMLRNDFAFFESSMAANVLAAHAVPVNWHFQQEEAGYIFRDCAAKAIVAHADFLPQIDGAIPDGVELFVVETPDEIRDTYGIDPALCKVPEGAREWSSWLESQELVELPPPPPPSTMIYTSGTTGNPKGVRRKPMSDENAETFGAMISQIFGFREGEFRTAVTGPMYHSAPNAYGLYAARGGGFCVLQPRFEEEGLLRLIEEHKLTHLHMVPTMFVRLLKLPDEIKTKYDLSSLEFVVHAAAPCPPDVKRRMIEWWGPVINEYYGSTETGGVIFHNAEEALANPGTVGRPIEGATVKIYDDEGKELDANEIGNVYLAMEGFPDFTYNKLDEKRREIEIDGMVTAGDVGYLDDDGFLFLCDRKNDMVISGGVNIYPAEIEAALIGMPGVKDCAVFGIPNEEFGEELCAYVEPEPGESLTDGGVREFLIGKLAKYKVPRRIVFQNDLPREDSGKIFKRKLRAPYWEDAGRSI
ncbi:MAG: acyl-CoA synthetase [Acidobacteriota bacterium]